MKRIRVAVIATSGLGLLLAFQNCSSKKFSDASEAATSASSAGQTTDSPASTGSGANVSTSGSSITAFGQTLTFKNNSGLASGSATVTDASSDIMVYLMDPLAGRTATVKIKVDPSTHKFTSVESASNQPWMCHDQNAQVCAPYPNLTSGNFEPNCHSAINYSGAINGSVNNLSGMSADSSCQSASAGCVATLVLPGNDLSNTAATVQPSAAACQSSCQDQFNTFHGAYPVRCSYNGQALPTIQ